MKITKKLISLALAAMLLLGLAVPAMAADDEFVMSGTKLLRYIGSGGDVVIPDGVTEIVAYAFSNSCGEKVTSVAIPGSVTKIGNYAFKNCSSMTSVNIAPGLTTIGDEAFMNCDSLASITLPDTVTEIRSCAFEHCSSLTSFTIPSSLTEISIAMFYMCSNLASVTIPSSVTKINGYAFYWCHSLTSVDIPYGVEEIGSDAFFDCSNLASVTIPSSVTKIGGAVFSGCYSLTSITIPSSVTEIGGGTFNGCAYITDIYFGGTQEQWEKFEVHKTNYYTFLDPQFRPNIHYNSTGPDAPEPTPDVNFSDVPADAWYAAPVAWALEKEITNGTSKDTFSPEKTCNTAEILTFLWRACDKPSAPAANLSDVDSGSWYADAANWAKSKGMISGNKLSPDTPCTRASTVMFIWQAMGKPTASKTASFSDVPADSDYAAAVAWAVEKGVTNGTGADTFSPDDICTRGHIVTFLQRAYAE